jgi:hypothetical protein
MQISYSSSLWRGQSKNFRFAEVSQVFVQMNVFFVSEDACSEYSDVYANNPRHIEKAKEGIPWEGKEETSFHPQTIPRPPSLPSIVSVTQQRPRREECEKSPLHELSQKRDRPCKRLRPSPTLRYRGYEHIIVLPIVYVCSLSSSIRTHTYPPINNASPGPYRSPTMYTTLRKMRRTSHRPLTWIGFLLP